MDSHLTSDSSNSQKSFFVSSRCQPGPRSIPLASAGRLGRNRILRRVLRKTIMVPLREPRLRRRSAPPTAVQADATQHDRGCRSLHLKEIRFDLSVSSARACQTIRVSLLLFKQLTWNKSENLRIADYKEGSFLGPLSSFKKKSTIMQMRSRIDQARWRYQTLQKQKNRRDF
jgi:hypothetical protein